MSAGCDVLVLAAFSPELAGLKEALGDDLAGRVGSVEVCAITVGIGLVEAACGTVAALAKFHPRAVVLIGTCGAYRESGLSICDVVVARCARLAEPAVLERRAAFPPIMKSQIDAHGALTSAMAHASQLPRAPVDVVTTLAITTDDGLAAALANSGAVEHLESFAVALACDAVPVPFIAALGVANRVGQGGRSEWEANHDAAGRAAANVVLKWIQQGTARVAASVA